MTPSPYDGLGVVVVTHADGRAAQPLLRQLLDEGVAPEAVAVVQNPTSPGDPALVAPDPAIAVLRMEHNLGYAAAMNRGMALHLERGARKLALLTHDVRFAPGALARLLEAADADRFGVVGPVLRDAAAGRAFSYGGVRDRFGRTRHRIERPPPTEDGVAECEWVDGAALVVRREVLEAVGLYEERFFGYCDDSELCLRAARAGWRVGVALEAVAEQETAVEARPAAVTYLKQRNGLELARRAAGPAGVLARLGDAAALLAVELARVVLTRIGLRAHDTAVVWARARGLCRGAFDFALRRFGPPPASLPGAGFPNTRERA